VRNVRNVGGDGNGWRENSKFAEKNIEGFSKILGRTYQKREPHVFYIPLIDYFYIPLIDFFFILLQNLNN
jgi:hypothetical protein